MEYTTIPGIENKASRVALGTWAIGGWLWGGTDEAESIRTIHAALDAGVNIIDTAPVYGFGRSEEIVGKALASWSGPAPLTATKAALEWTADGKVVRNSTPQRIAAEVEDSLRRLQVERIDVYQVHWPDERVPLEDTAAEMLRLKEAGKIAAIGVSNYSPAQMDAFSAVAPLATCQPPYNVFERAIEADVLPHCTDKGIATLTYGALCRGLLSGRMRPDTTFEGDDLRNWDPKFQAPRFEQYLGAVQALDDLARGHGRTVLQLAVRFVLDKGASIALWGARRPDQMQPLDGVFGWSLDDGDFKAIDAVLAEHVRDPVGPEFMGPPHRE